MIPLRDVLYKAIDRKRNARALYGAQLQMLWPKIIENLLGDQASMGSRVECLKGNTLVIRVSSSPLASELRHFGPEIIQKLNKEINSAVVARLSFRA